MELLAIFDASAFFDWFVHNANYLLVFAFMVVESSFIPFPSEVIVPPAAYLAVQPLSNLPAGVEPMNVYIIVVVATAGALTGSLINYYLSLWIGRPAVYKFANSWLGHLLFLDQQKVEKAEAYFDKHGAVSTFVGRLIPAVRQLISIPAGIARMDLKKFCLYTVLGAGVWNVVLTVLGAWLGHEIALDQLFPLVEEYNEYLTWAGLGILGLCVALMVWNALKHRKHKTEN